jgi:2'-5' RNA ligase
MRVFVGIPAEDSFKAEGIAWQESHRSLPVRMINERDFHMTIIPPWEVDDIAAETAKVQLVAKEVLCDVNFVRFAPRPSMRAPHSIGAEAVEIPTSLTKLFNETYRVFNRQPEARPFLPHCTLARVPKDIIFRAFVDDVRWVFPVRRVALFVSHMEGSGAWYEIAAEVNLAS